MHHADIASTDELFARLVVSSRPRRRSPWGLLAALFFHGAGGAAIVVVPLLVASEAPEPRETLKVLVSVAVPLPPPAPPRPSAATVRRAAAPAAAPVRRDEFVAPIETPDEIRPEPEPAPEAEVEEEETGTEGLGEETALFDRLTYAPDVPPRPIHMTRPRFPPEAAAALGEGRQTVQVEILIDSMGRVAKARIRRSVPLLDQAAIECVSEWLFKPAEHGGKKVSTILVVAVNFGIESH